MKRTILAFGLGALSVAAWFGNTGKSGGQGVESGLSCGDANGDGSLDVSDAVYLLRHLFTGGPELRCLAACNPPLGAVCEELNALKERVAALEQDQDADTLDRLDSTDFATANHTHEIPDGSIQQEKLAFDPVTQPELESVKRVVIESLGIPVGGVTAWLKSEAGTPPLPANFVECNGQALNDPESPYDGKVIPNLNGAAGTTQRFLRGSATSGSTGGSETHVHGLPPSPAPVDGTQFLVANFSVTDAASTLPSYYEVVWVMRIK